MADKRNNNTISKGMFIFESIIAEIIAIFMYRVILLRCVGNLDYYESIDAFFVLTVVFTLFGIAVTYGKHRNAISIFINTVTPLGLFTVASYYRTAPVLIWSFVALAIVLSLAYVIPTFAKKIKNEARRKTIISSRIRRSFVFTRFVTAFCLFVPVLVLAFGIVFRFKLVSPSTEPVENPVKMRNEIEDNSEVIKYTEEKAWKKLSTKEKLNVLQSVADIEAAHLGVPHGLKVITSVLTAGTAASYDDENHKIAIDADYLENRPVSDVVKSVCHEARHAYQYCVCEMYNSLTDEQKELLIFRDVEALVYNFSDYKSGIVNFDEYVSQKCEVDAREYAESRCEFYSTTSKS